jgi:hypothetical protein
VPSFVIPRPWLCHWPRPWLALALAGAGAVSCSAEVIHLKNGDVIYADSVKEGANRVEYAIGDDTYAIPISRVQSIESGIRPKADPPPSQAEIAAYTPDTHPVGEGRLLEKIVHQGTVDRIALGTIEAQHDTKQSAEAFYVAGKLDYLTGN